MKLPISLVMSGVLLLAVFPCFSAAAVSDAAQGPETPKEKYSYSIGYEIGIGMRSDAVNVDLDTVMQGMRDAVGGKEPRLSRDEMRKLLVDLKKRVREAEMRQLQEMMVRNAEESDRFLSENGRKKGVRTTASGLQYQVLKEGRGESPGPEDTVTVHYRGTFPDGKEFDSSYAGGAPRTVDADGVIKGWTEALVMMKAGSKWRIFVPPDLAYGRAGMVPKIPPNKVLVFEIELLSFSKNEKGGESSRR